MADKLYWMRQPLWQASFILLGLLLWCFYLAFSWISALPSLAQALLGVAVGLTSMASYSNAQTQRSHYRRRATVNLAQLSVADMLGLQRLLPNHEKALSWLPGPLEVELVRWINVGLEKAWPFFKEASSGLIKVKLEAVYNRYKSGAIQEILVGKINLGKFCPFVQGIKAVPNNGENQCCLEVQLDWRQNEDQEMLLHVLTAGPEYLVQVKNFVVYCVIWLTFTPLTQELPCFAAVVCSIIEPEWKRPSIEHVQNILLAALMDVLVWPSRVVAPVLPGDYSDLEASCMGHLSVQLVEARNLANKDITGRSDPYVVLFVRWSRDSIKESTQMHDTVDPMWNEQFVFNVEDSEVQKLTIKLMNMDEAKVDVFVGTAELAICQLGTNILEDLWIDLVGDPAKLRGKSAGKVHLLVEFKPINQTGVENDSGSRAFTGSAPSAVSFVQPDEISTSTREDRSGAKHASQSFGNADANGAASDGLRAILEENDTASVNNAFRPVTLNGAVAALTDFYTVGAQGSPTAIMDKDAQPRDPADKEENSIYPEEKTRRDCCEDGNAQPAREVGVVEAENQVFLESKKDLYPLHVGEGTDSPEGIGTDSNKISQPHEETSIICPEGTDISSTEDNSSEACNPENVSSNVEMDEDTRNLQNLLVVGDPAWGLNGLSLEHCNSSIIHEDIFSSEIFEVD